MRFSNHQGKKLAKMAVADAAETDAELEEADEIAEIKRQAAAEVQAEKEKAKVQYALSFNMWHSPPLTAIGLFGSGKKLYSMCRKTTVVV